jgi:hypothetical protein
MAKTIGLTFKPVKKPKEKKPEEGKPSDAEK